MTGPRTSLVTGANTGIGLVTARELARRGDRVILAGRSEEKTRAAMATITEATGNADLEHLPLDLGDLASVRAAADALVDRGEPIHVLVANAGLAGQRGQTAQGFELAFGTNHLGHFLFVTSLLPLLEAAAEPGAPARVVVVASDSHYQPKAFDLSEVRRPTRTRSALREYGVSKLANVLFAQELARRVDPAQIWVGSLHPGVIASDVWRQVPWPVRPIMTRFMKSTDDGARTSLMCATEASVLPHHGAYYSEGELKDPSPLATPANGAALWAQSEAWIAELAT